MKKKIATLEVYTDTEYDNNAIEEHGTGYILRIGADRDADQKRLQTVLAHELGHFIALVTDDITHKREYRLYADLTKDPTPLIEGEKLAWKLAHEMLPEEGFDKAREQEAIGSYIKGAEYYKYMDILRDGLLRVLREQSRR